MSVFKLCVAGPPSFKDQERLNKAIDQVLSEKIKTHEIVILYGSYTSFDNLVFEYSKDKELFSQKFIADWKNDGKQAGAIRTTKELENADAVLIFDDSVSKGLEIFKSIASKKSLPMRIVKVGGLPESA